MNKVKNKKRFRSAIAICLVAAIVIGGAYALLSAYDSRINRFTSGTLSLTLTENNWNEASAKDLLPLQTVSKNPQVINDKGNIDAWVYVSVKVPSTNAEYETEDAPVSIGADGTDLVNEAIKGGYYDLFSLLNREAGEDSIGVNSDWELVAYDYSHRDEAKGYTTYYYAYTKEALCGYSEMEYVTTEDGDYSIIEEKGITSALFDEVQLANIAQRPEPSEILQHIDVQAYGIQKDNIDNVYQGWAVLANQNEIVKNNSEFEFCINGYSAANGTVSFSAE